MGVLYETDLVFYHPLDSRRDHADRDWTGAQYVMTTPGGRTVLPPQGAHVAWSGQQEIESHNYTQISVAATGSTTWYAFMAYRDASDGYGYVRIGQINPSGHTVAWGTPQAFCTTSAVSGVRLVALSTTKIVVAYCEANDGCQGKTKVGIVSTTGKSVTSWGNADVFQAGQTLVFDMVAMTNSQVVVAYKDSANGHGTARVGDITASTQMIWRTPASFQTAGAGVSDIVLCNDGASNFAVAYADLADHGHGTSKYATIVDKVITYGAETEFAYSPVSNGVRSMSLTALPDDRFAVAYTTSITPTILESRVGLLHNNVIEWGSATIVNTGKAVSSLRLASPGGNLLLIGKGTDNSLYQVAGTYEDNQVHWCQFNLVSGSPTGITGFDVGLSDVNRPVFLAYGDSGGSARTKLGTYVQTADITADGSGYLSACARGTSPITVAVFNSSGNAFETIFERGWRVTGSGSTITLNGVNWSGEFQTGSDHMELLRFEHEAGTTWRLWTCRGSGNGWVDRGTQAGVSVPATDTPPRIAFSGCTTSSAWVDDVALWIGAPKFSPLQIDRLGSMMVNGIRLDQYTEIWESEQSESARLFIQGPMPSNRGAGLLCKADDLPLESSGCVFYHPLNNHMEWTRRQEWAGFVGFVNAQVGSGITATTALQASVSPEGTQGRLMDGVGGTGENVVSPHAVPITDNRVFCAWLDNPYNKHMLGFVERTPTGVVVTSGIDIWNTGDYAHWRSVVANCPGVLLDYDPTTTSGCIFQCLYDYEYGRHAVHIVSFSGTTVLSVGSGSTSNGSWSGFVGWGSDYGDTDYSWTSYTYTHPNPRPQILYTSGEHRYIYVHSRTKWGQTGLGYFAGGYRIVLVSGSTIKKMGPIRVLDREWDGIGSADKYSYCSGPPGVVGLADRRIAVGYNRLYPPMQVVRLGTLDVNALEVAWDPPVFVGQSGKVQSWNGFVNQSGGAAYVFTNPLYHGDYSFTCQPICQSGSFTGDQFSLSHWGNGGQKYSRWIANSGWTTALGRNIYLGAWTNHGTVLPIDDRTFALLFTSPTQSKPYVALGWTDNRSGAVDGWAWQAVQPSAVIGVDTSGYWGINIAKCDGGTLLATWARGPSETSRCHLSAAVGTITGTGLGTRNGNTTWGSPQIKDDGDVRYPFSLARSSTSGLIFWVDPTATGYYLRAYYRTGDAISFGDKVSVNTVSLPALGNGGHLIDACVTDYAAGGSADAQDVFVAYTCGSGPNAGVYGRKIRASGTSLSTLIPETLLYGRQTLGVCVRRVDDSRVIIAVNGKDGHTPGAHQIEAMLVTASGGAMTMSSRCGALSDSIPYTDGTPYVNGNLSPVLLPATTDCSRWLLVGGYAVSQVATCMAGFCSVLAFSGGNIAKTQFIPIDIRSDAVSPVFLAPVGSTGKEFVAWTRATQGLEYEQDVLGGVKARSLLRVVRDKGSGQAPEFLSQAFIDDRRTSAVQYEDTMSAASDWRGFYVWVSGANQPTNMRMYVVDSGTYGITTGPVFQIHDKPAFRYSYLVPLPGKNGCFSAANLGQNLAYTNVDTYGRWYDIGFSGCLHDTTAAYPKVSGQQSLMLTAWLRNPGTDGNAWLLTKGYKFKVGQSAIQFGSGTVTWSGAQVQSLLGSLNDNAPRLMVARLDWLGSGNWNLKVSTDGGPWVDYGQQSSGTEALLSVASEAGPEVALLPSGESGPTTWSDESALWAKTDLPVLSTLDLQKMYHLGATFRVGLDGFGQYARVPTSGYAPLVVLGPSGETQWEHMLYHQTFNTCGARPFIEYNTGASWTGLNATPGVGFSGEAGIHQRGETTATYQGGPTYPTTILNSSQTWTAAFRWKKEAGPGFNEDEVFVGRNNAGIAVGQTDPDHLRIKVRVNGVENAFPEVSIPPTSVNDWNFYVVHVSFSGGTSYKIAVNSSAWNASGSIGPLTQTVSTTTNLVSEELNDGSHRYAALDDACFWKDADEFTWSQIWTLHEGHDSPWYKSASASLTIGPYPISGTAPLFIIGPHYPPASGDVVFMHPLDTGAPEWQEGLPWRSTEGITNTPFMVKEGWFVTSGSNPFFGEFSSNYKSVEDMGSGLTAFMWASGTDNSGTEVLLGWFSQSGTQPNTTLGVRFLGNNEARVIGTIGTVWYSGAAFSLPSSDPVCLMLRMAWPSGGSDLCFHQSINGEPWSEAGSGLKTDDPGLTDDIGIRVRASGAFVLDEATLWYQAPWHNNSIQNQVYLGGPYARACIANWSDVWAGHGAPLSVSATLFIAGGFASSQDASLYMPVVADPNFSSPLFLACEGDCLIYSHDCDTAHETVRGVDWDVDGPSFVDGYWGKALGRDAYVHNISGTYQEVAGFSNRVYTWSMWLRNPGINNGFVQTGRGYELEINSSGVSFHDARWAPTALLNTLNDGGSHHLKISFDSQGGALWRMRAAVDGGTVTDYGNQYGDSPLAVEDAESEPFIWVTGGVEGGPDQWVDMVRMWAGSGVTTSEYCPKSFHECEVPPPLYIAGPLPDGSGTSLHIYGKGYGCRSGDLYVEGFMTHNGSGSLYTAGILGNSRHVDLWLTGFDCFFSTGNLYVAGCLPCGSGARLMALGHGYQGAGVLLRLGLDLSRSCRLRIRGTLTSGEMETAESKQLEDFLLAPNYHPQVIGKLTYTGPGDTATISVWQLTSGGPVSVPLAQSGCYALGSTGRWGWSTQYMPRSISPSQYHYQMAHIDGTTFQGTFFMRSREESSHLGHDPDSYLAKV